MTVASWWAARALKLPPADHQSITVERGVPIPMRDGVVLLADRYTPSGPGPAGVARPAGAGAAGDSGAPPTVLVRCPYGRGGLYGLLFGRLLAERGFIVLLQSTRGTFGSGGTFAPFREQDDGLDTVAWIEAQPWFSGQLGTTGISYLGLTQWATAGAAGKKLAASVIIASASQFRDATYPGEVLALTNTLTWTNLIARQERHAGLLRTAASARRVAAAMETLPLAGLDRATTGATADFWQEWLAHDQPGDGYWADRRFDGDVPGVAAAVALVAGWYDIFLPWQLADYAALRAAGASPRLTIGPWTHTAPEMTGTGLRETIAHLRTHLRGEPDPRSGDPVRIFVTGAESWRDYPDWPPPGTRTVRWHLHGGGRLDPAVPDPAVPGRCEPDRYRYDPADPTPALGGALLGGRAGRSSAVVDNRSVEARADVLTFTSAPLPADLEAIGPVGAELYVTPGAPSADFFVRLCDVHPDGRSMNVCDGIVRVTPAPAAADGPTPVIVELWPAAHQFRARHRLRVQVSSGAHPRYARNTGSGEPLAAAVTLVPAEHTLHHDPARPSALLLPALTP